jgi:hypothetical protein
MKRLSMWFLQAWCCHYRFASDKWWLSERLVTDTNRACIHDIVGFNHRAAPERREPASAL